ncbi:TetR/AcrR family transcriptional regulator [Streptomyces sp. NPDC055078]
MATSRWTAAGQTCSASLRRRGAVLERAILEAALDQLSTVGWSGLTMEGVAAGARTGKAAVYRRWPSKEDLVADALRAGLPPLEEAVDHGGVRDDLFHLCRQLRDVMFSRSGSAFRSVIHECDATTVERFESVIIHQVVEPSIQLCRNVILRGIRRGDVRESATAEMVFDVIPGLMMYRTKMYGSEWLDDDIAEMIDQVMVPLLRPHRR